MAIIQPQRVTPSGLGATYANADTLGDQFVMDNRGRTFLHVKNGAASGSVAVTIAPQRTKANAAAIGDVTVPPIVVNVPFGTERMIGGFAPAYINADGKVLASYSAVASVTVAALTVTDYTTGY